MSVTVVPIALPNAVPYRQDTRPRVGRRAPKAAGNAVVVVVVSVHSSSMKATEVSWGQRQPCRTSQASFTAPNTTCVYAAFHSDVARRAWHLTGRDATCARLAQVLARVRVRCVCVRWAMQRAFARGRWMGGCTAVPVVRHGGRYLRSKERLPLC
ncbi:hypothetical protein PLESTM_000219200 [Pleodorina starrii]|nr:hypothetical protein PLESTM_000219200 [Pleodorina starrii]